MNAEAPSIDNTVFSLYPNPNSGSFSVSLPTDEIFQTRIFDAQGRVVFDAALEGSQSLSLPLASGKYLAQFVSTSTQKHMILPFIVN